MHTFHIIVYGCQMNYSDAARIRAVLTNCGWVHVDNKEQADVLILDTCSVRQKSEDKVRGQLKECRKDQKVWLTGCMIQHNLNLKKTRTSKSKKYQQGNFVGTLDTREPTIVGLQKLDEDEQLKQIVKAYMIEGEDKTGELLYVNHAFDPLFYQMQRQFSNVELFFRINDVGLLPCVMRQLGYKVNPDIELINEYTSLIPQHANIMQQEATKTAYVPISSGCSQFCAYCIVPYARGLEKNRPVEEVITEVKIQVANGAEEIVLLGQIVNKHPDFYEILKIVSELPGVKWVRYTSPYPTYYDADIFALHNKRENICPHIHMPLQSGSNKILKKMFRGYTSEEYMRFVDSIRGLQRPISLTTDIIIGFCDETEEDFQQSMDLARYSEFDMIYMGIYSPRPGTYAAKKYEDNVPLTVKKERRQRMNELLKTLSIKNNITELGTARQMLVREVKDHALIGRTDNMKNLIIEQPSSDLGSIQVGQFLHTKIVRTEAFKLFGEVVEVKE